MTVKPLTKEEKKAVDALQKACDNLPNTFWCYLNMGKISIMRYAKENTTNYNDGLDQKLIIHDVHIGSAYGKGCIWDGGDW